MTLSIDTITAFIAVNEEGEGITAFVGPGGQWMPMVAADPERVESLRPIAEDIARITGSRIVVAEFSVRRDVEVIEP